MLFMTIKVAAATLIASTFIVLGDAQGRIVCDGNYQVVNGLPVATPYCREENLGRVARGRGMGVSDDALRYSESAKAEVCRTIGYDIRVQEICTPYRNDGGSNRGR